MCFLGYLYNINLCIYIYFTRLKPDITFANHLFIIYSKILNINIEIYNTQKKIYINIPVNVSLIYYRPLVSPILNSNSLLNKRLFNNNHILLYCLKYIHSVIF
jgi:hypothetical protein